MVVLPPLTETVVAPIGPFKTILIGPEPAAGALMDVVGVTRLTLFPLGLMLTQVELAVEYA